MSSSYAAVITSPIMYSHTNQSRLTITRMYSDFISIIVRAHSLIVWQNACLARFSFVTNVLSLLACVKGDRLLDGLEALFPRIARLKLSII